jgi:hypothetical protein
MGEVVGGVRCDVTRTKRFHAKQTTKAPAKPGQPKNFEDMADDIPFDKGGQP